MNVYDDIADRYDQITGADRRAAAAEAFVDRMMERFDIASVLDVACGTGLYAQAAARRHLRVVGADLSEGMLARARERAAAKTPDIRWVAAPMESLAETFDERFDAVFCMGNSIPHVLRRPDLHKTLGGFVRLTASDGIIAVHLINYARVMSMRDPMVGTERHGERQYVRSYEFMDDGRLDFVVTAADACGAPAEEISRTVLQPWRADELADGLRSAGCRTVELFAGLALEPFNEAESDTVLVLAHGPVSESRKTIDARRSDR